MNNLRIPFIRPTMPAVEDWSRYLESAYAAKWFSNFGPVNQMLERELSIRFGSTGRTFVLTSSATTGLAAILLALGIRGEVALPAFTFPATLRAIEMAGCVPVLCDVDSETWEMSAATLEPVLARNRIEAVVPVRAFGLCRDHGSLLSLCARAGVPVILDSAAAFGGRLDTGELVGSQGVAEVFSFHATKVFGIGEGGVVCVDGALADDVRSAINFGMAPKWTDRGLNGKLAEFGAAIGLAVLERFNDFVTHRGRVAARYMDALSSYPAMKLPMSVGHPVWQCFPVLLQQHIDRDQFLKLSLSAGVEIRRYYWPALSPGHDNASVVPSLETSRKLAESMVCLPVYSDMSSAEQNEVLTVIEGILQGRDVVDRTEQYLRS